MPFPAVSGRHATLVQSLDSLAHAGDAGRPQVRFFILLCAHLGDEVPCYPYGAASTRRRRRSNPARPYMDRLMTFNRLIWPSTGPVLQGIVRAACTASRSCRRLPAKPLKPSFSAALIQSSSRSARPSLIMVENALASSTARAIGGDSSSSAVTNRRSSALSLSGSLISRRAALRGVGGGGLGRFGRCRPIRGRVLTAPAGGPLPDDARLPGEAALTDLPSQPGAVATA